MWTYISLWGLHWIYGNILMVILRTRQVFYQKTGPTYSRKTCSKSTKSTAEHHESFPVEFANIFWTTILQTAPDVYFRPCQISMMQFFWKTISNLFERVLNTPLNLQTTISVESGFGFCKTWIIRKKLRISFMCS